MQRYVLTPPATKENAMPHTYWNDWYFGWGWFLWFGVIFLLFSSLGNWGYTYRAHQRFGAFPRKEAFDVLDTRYAKGEITLLEYKQMKSDISKE
jgi:putative membrane protein